MSKIIKLLIFLSILLALLYLLLGYASSYIGWYGYKKWENRVSSGSIEESKRRGVFVKELSFQADSSYIDLDSFRPFIEEGFKYGKHTSESTVHLINTSFPYQLKFNFRPNDSATILIREDQLIKFDSSNAVWGFMKEKHLPDTVILTVRGNNIKPSSIKVWE
jgi:hypothetical protein